ncbi:hypothetical protein ESY86_12500 [Subsaximicrobium wynnwilliamsii]|jgi:hypothetical protein|uniref:Uncharacterized protein n=1 Tax=Subsaximicrobium wynnwilliamsii TaxID=291179 RepID=A0A5C6ZEY3_9FLAO|nr:hypothetical protein [Subsaximicrobium wynnwilliamsii]TXD82831.1 hypothetical protein ESY87_12540 [Subsaximicrobium wynnwilliamsii]TXD88553.1 hypothetical protein ESY86_12500 [Subsaximicrobium wynnwilliamsii]TXE02450.1 hypothetical protein ESY88_11865 [Subsaximicrobium wynnwilliamsii]
MKKRFLFISCEQAYLICDKAQYGEANLWERFELMLRLSWCKFARAYTKDNCALTAAIHSSKDKLLTEIEREEFRKNLERLIHKQPQH